MSQALYTSMGGIAAATNSLSVVSNNIANMNTIAFKESTVTFENLFSNTISSGSAATSTTGGTNPMQIGLGTKVSTIETNFSNGTWTSTGNSSDMMIDGSGYFTVESPTGKVYYTRDGQFTLDNEGNLVTAGGYKVLGTSSLYSATSSGTSVNVPSSIVSTVQAYQGDLSKVKLTELNHCDLTSGSLKFSVTDKSTTPSTTNNYTANINVTANGTDTTLEDIVNQISASLGTGSGVTVGMGAAGTANAGKITFTVDDPTNKTISFSSSSTSNFLGQTGIGSAKMDSASGVISTEILDYQVEIDPVTSMDSSISETGYSISEDGAITVTYSNGDTLSTTVNSDATTYGFKYTTSSGVVICSDTTDTTTTSHCNVNKNVAEPASLRLQLATVTNQNGFLSMGSNLFSAGPDTGTIIYTIANSMGLGKIQSGGLEASNVDISEQFSNMILAQRAIEANSRVFSAANDTLQTIVRLGQ